MNFMIKIQCKITRFLPATQYFNSLYTHYLNDIDLILSTNF